MDDGLLEVVGVTGVVHMVSAGAGDRGAGLWRCGPLSMAPPLPHQGQVQGGLRSGIRIAQGSYFRVTLLKAAPVQVDGEPWVQAPGHMIISAAGPKVYARRGLGRGIAARRPRLRGVAGMAWAPGGPAAAGSSLTRGGREAG